MNEKILDYLNNALDDAARSRFEQQMRDDADLRQQVARTRRLQHRVAENLRGDLNTIDPPATMTFAALAPRIHRRRIAFRQRFGYTFAAFAAVVVLLFAVIYSLPDEAIQPIEGGVMTEIPTTDLFTISTVTPLSLTLTTNSVNAPSIPIRTPTPSGGTLLESTTDASGNSVVTRTPFATEER